MTELFLLMAFLIGFLWAFTVIKRRQEARMVKDFEEFLRTHPEVTTGLPIYKIEIVKGSDQQELFLAYEDLSNKFAGQGNSLESLIATLQQKHPAQSIFARDGEEYYEIKPAQ